MGGGGLNSVRPWHILSSGQFRAGGSPRFSGCGGRTAAQTRQLTCCAAWQSSLGDKTCSSGKHDAHEDASDNADDGNDGDSDQNHYDDL